MCSLCTKGDEFSFTRWAINTFVECEVDVREICETCVWLADDRRESGALWGDDCKGDENLPTQANTKRSRSHVTNRLEFVGRLRGSDVRKESLYSGCVRVSMSMYFV